MRKTCFGLWFSRPSVAGLHMGGDTDVLYIYMDYDGQTWKWHCYRASPPHCGAWTKVMCWSVFDLRLPQGLSWATTCAYIAWLCTYV